MTKKNKIIVSITGITLVLLILVGLTYAYFLTRIQGNTNTKSISVTTADLALVYGDGNGEIGQQKIKPGTVIGTKEFTVENTGNATTEYGVFLESVINELTRTQDAVITMTCTSSVANKTCNGYNDAMPYQNDLLTTNSIDVSEVQTYELTLEYVEAGIDQSVDMNKELSGKVQIYDLNNTVDLAGIITDYNPGDYVVVNSEPKESQIRSDGSYKVVGLTPDNHTVTVYNSNDTVKYTKSLTINKGETESISGTIATIVDNSREIITSISNSSIVISQIKQPSSKVWTLTDSDSSGGISVGDLITSKKKATEQFYVIGIDGDTVSMLSKYNLKKVSGSITLEQDTDVDAIDEEQNSSNAYAFSSTDYWDPNVKLSYPLANGKYPNLNDTRTYPLGSETSIITTAADYGESLDAFGRLMTYEETNQLNASNSTIIYGQYETGKYLNYWLGSAFDCGSVWSVDGGGSYLDNAVYDYDDDFGVRPVIEASIDSIE